VQVLGDVWAGLNHLNRELKFVHGDVKWSNIF
jgi:hypothetical protein